MTLDDEEWPEDPFAHLKGLPNFFYKPEPDFIQEPINCAESLLASGSKLAKGLLSQIPMPFYDPMEHVPP
eukprot:g13913.t1